ncbi:MAG: hypothetical protein ACK4ZE_06165 [Sphingorhabdus sp.]
MRELILAIALTTSLSAAPVLAANENAKPVTTTATDPDQAIKCRKVEVTGSLVKKGKVCKTIAEWKEIQANGNRTARAIIESGGVCSGGSCGNGGQ